MVLTPAEQMLVEQLLRADDQERLRWLRTFRDFSPDVNVSKVWAALTVELDGRFDASARSDD